MSTLTPVITRPSTAFMHRRKSKLHEDEETGESTDIVPAIASTIGQRQKTVKEPSATSQDETPAPFECSRGLDSIENPQTRQFFRRLHANTPFVLITLASADNSRVYEVKVQEHDDDEQILRKMKALWEQMGFFSRLRKVTRVEEVKLRFAGLKGHQKQEVLIALCEPIDLAKRRQDLEEQWAAVECTVKDIYYDDDRDWCYRGNLKGKYRHGVKCPNRGFERYKCPIEQYDELPAQMDRLTLVPILTQALCSPELARGQDLFIGLAEDWGHGCYSARLVLRTSYGCDSVGNAVFNGYKIVDDWHPMLYQALLPAGSTMTVASCFLFRIIFGDWQTAFAAASVALAVTAVAIQWIICLSHDI